MKRASSIQIEAEQITTIEGLTSVFESIASLKIAKIRNRVVKSKEFFGILWSTYQQLRIDPSARVEQRTKGKKGGIAFVAITSDGKLGGEISDLVTKRLYDTLNTDSGAQPKIIAIGSHGATKLREYFVEVTHEFPLPDSDEEFSVTNITEVLSQYDEATVFYQTYESLRNQKVARIDLNSAVQILESEAEQAADTEIVSSKNYIFEPDIKEIADYLEIQMMGVALTQAIMESKLAQHASRFNAMNSAKNRAHDLSADLTRQFHRSKRNESDERLKEIMKVIVNGSVA